MLRIRRPSNARVPASSAAVEYANADVPRPVTPWRDARYCVVDLELSGLDPRRDEIISFGAVPVEGGRLITGHAVYGVCRPTRPIPARSVLVHGIRSVDLEGAPPLDEAVEPLIAAMAGRVVVAHVAQIETSFLRPLFLRKGLRLRAPMLDTYELGRLWATERGTAPPTDSLGSLAESLGLPVHHPHHALSDALTTAQVFVALATLLDAASPETVQSLAKAGHRATKRRRR